MDKLTELLKAIYPNEWAARLHIIDQMTTVVGTYQTRPEKFHMGIHELSNYLYDIDTPLRLSISDSDNTRLAGSYNYAINFLRENNLEHSDEFITTKNLLIKNVIDGLSVDYNYKD